MGFFPHPSTANQDGLVASTDGLSVELLLEAYQAGIFPWSSDPVRWYSPDPRALFLLDRTKPPSRFQRTIRKEGLRVTVDRDFEGVIRACREAHGAEHEWISEEFVRTYTLLHEAGIAHSVEVWQKRELVGGIYGVEIGGMFSGESMFHRIDNASKVAFAGMIHVLKARCCLFMDAQVINPHTHRLGAVLVSRPDYLMLLEVALKKTVSPGRWDHALLAGFPQTESTGS